MTPIYVVSWPVIFLGSCNDKFASIEPFDGPSSVPYAKCSDDETI